MFKCSGGERLAGNSRYWQEETSAENQTRPQERILRWASKITVFVKPHFAADGLKEVIVNNYEEINARMEEGTVNRTVASTNMNATSSRAHTIVGVRSAPRFEPRTNPFSGSYKNPRMTPARKWKRNPSSTLLIWLAGNNWQPIRV